MVTISPFKALRPEAQHAKNVASRPYDVLNSKEAKVEAQGNPYSFLHITKSEIDLPEDTDIHAQAVRLLRGSAIRVVGVAEGSTPGAGKIDCPSGDMTVAPSHPQRRR